MTQKAETKFSNSLHSKLDKELIYFEKTANPFRKGMPDFYYEGIGSNIWCEHKHILKLWTSNKEPEDICKSQSWPSQHRWLNRANKNKQKTLVIVGIGSGKESKAYILRWPFNYIITNKAETLEQTALIIQGLLKKWDT